MQVADWVAVATTPAQVLLPVAVTTLVTEHALAGEVKVAVKLAEAPGARLGTVNTVAGDAWLSTTVTLMSATLPGLLTVPEYVIGFPVITWFAGQFKVTAMRGEPVTEQVVVAELVTTLPAQLSRERAVNVDVMEQSVPAGTL